MPSTTEPTDASAPSTDGEPRVEAIHGGPPAGVRRRAYSAPRLRPLGRVAELMRGSAGPNKDAHTAKAHT